VTRLSPQLLRAAVTGGTAADETKERVFARLLGGLPEVDIDRRAASVRRAPSAAATAARDGATPGMAPQPRPPRRHRLGIARGLRPHHRRAARRRRRPCHAPRSWRWWAPDGPLRRQELPRAEKFARLSGGCAPRASGVGMPSRCFGPTANGRGDLRLLNAADHGVNAGRPRALRSTSPVPLPRRRRAPGTGDPLSDGELVHPGVVAPATT